MLYKYIYNSEPDERSVKEPDGELNLNQVFILASASQFIEGISSQKENALKGRLHPACIIQLASK